LSKSFLPIEPDYNSILRRLKTLNVLVLLIKQAASFFFLFR